MFIVHNLRACNISILLRFQMYKKKNIKSTYIAQLLERCFTTHLTQFHEPNLHEYERECLL